MDPNELLLLGLLDQQSMHGYRLHEFLEDHLHFVSDLKKPTAYRLLEQLYRQGLVERAYEREGRRPERMVYHLTAAGRTRFEQLLRAQLADGGWVRHPWDVALLFSDRLAPAERRELLERRRRAVEAQRSLIAAFVAAHPEGTPARLVVEHDLAHVETELAWLTELAASVKEVGSAWKEVTLD